MKQNWIRKKIANDQIEDAIEILLTHFESNYQNIDNKCRRVYDTIIMISAQFTNLKFDIITDEIDKNLRRKQLIYSLLKVVNMLTCDTCLLVKHEEVDNIRETLIDETSDYTEAELDACAKYQLINLT